MSSKTQPSAQVPRPVVFVGSGGQPFPELVSLVRAYAAPQPPEVLVFGDSVLMRTARDDKDPRALGRMIRDALPTTGFELSRSALNPELIHGFVKTLGKLNKPKVIVIPINVRCFLPQWDLHPAWPLKSELHAISEWFADPSRPILPVEDVEETPDFYRDYDSASMETGLSPLTTIGQFREVIASEPSDPEGQRERSRQIFIYHYGYPLDPNNRKVVSLVSAVALMRELGIKPVVYATPLNMEGGGAIAGPGFSKRVEDNIAVVRDRLKAVGVDLHDYTSALPAAAFFHLTLPTEHLCDFGRQALCGWICEQVARA